MTWYIVVMYRGLWTSMPHVFSLMHITMATAQSHFSNIKHKRFSVLRATFWCNFTSVEHHKSFGGFMPSAESHTHNAFSLSVALSAAIIKWKLQSLLNLSQHKTQMDNSISLGCDWWKGKWKQQINKMTSGQKKRSIENS